MNSEVEEIKSRLNLIDILGEYIRLEKAGANFKARCPFHNEKIPSFMASEDKQIWHCFGCGKGGDIFGFVMEMEGMDFKEALKFLADKAGVKIQRFDPQKENQKNRTLEILDLASRFYEAQLWKSSAAPKILAYLRERGIKEGIMKDFRLGFAPAGWRNLANFLVSRGYGIEEIKKTGLLVEKKQALPADSKNAENSTAGYYDRFRDRIIFPIADSSGKIVGFSARVAPGQDESQAKYVNTPETEVYHKSRVLFGLDKAKSEIKIKGWTFLVEGNLDVIASFQAGIKNVVAVSGTALTPDHLGILKRYTDNLRICFDKDSAGEIATKKSLKLCFEKGLGVKVVELPSGKDAADLAKNNPVALRQSTENAQEAMEYLFHKSLGNFDKNQIEGKKKIAEELLEMIAFLASELEKSHWIKQLARELETKESVLTDMLKKAKIRDRIKRTSSEPGTESGENFSSQEKLEILTQGIVGLMLVYDSVWRRVQARQKIQPIFLEDELFQLLVEKGEESEFIFEKFVSQLKDQELISRAEKLFLEKKYRFDLNNNLEEIQLPDPLVEMEKYLKEIRREIGKKELEKIEKDLKKAEEDRDQEAIKFLREEVRRISQEISEIQ